MALIYGTGSVPFDGKTKLVVSLVLSMSMLTWDTLDLQEYRRSGWMQESLDRHVAFHTTTLQRWSYST